MNFFPVQDLKIKVMNSRGLKKRILKPNNTGLKKNYEQNSGPFSSKLETFFLRQNILEDIKETSALYSIEWTVLNTSIQPRDSERIVRRAEKGRSIFLQLYH